MSRKMTDFLNNPLSDGRLKPFQSILVFVCSILVNAYFQVTSFSAMARWLLKLCGAENVSMQLAEILSRTETPIGMRIVFGLMMTVFVMVFMLIAALLMNVSFMRMPFAKPLMQSGRRKPKESLRRKSGLYSDLKYGSTTGQAL